MQKMDGTLEQPDYYRVVRRWKAYRIRVLSIPIVILDEPTASLDPKAEYEIYQQFSGLVEGKSAVFITHRLSSAQFCDKIAVFQQGGMIEYGTHKQLLAQNGVYASLYQMQAQYYYKDKNNAAIDGMDTQEL